MPFPPSLKALYFYPPFIGAGISVRDHGPRLEFIEVEMKLNRFNRNVVGTQFGGSLYMMCDPFFMAILMHRLGPNYIVWDKAASIQFLKPGRSKVRARFEIAEAEIARIQVVVDNGAKCEPEFDVDILDTNGTCIATVHKVLYVRKKPAKS